MPSTAWISLEGSRPSLPLKEWSVVKAPAASTLKTVPPLVKSFTEGPAIRSRAVEAAIGRLDQAGIRISSVAPVEGIVGGERPRSIDLVNRAETLRTAGLRGAVKAAIGGLDQAGTRVSSVAPAERIERGERTRNIDFEDRTDTEGAARG